MANEIYFKCINTTECIQNTSLIYVRQHLFTTDPLLPFHTFIINNNTCSSTYLYTYACN